MRTVSAYRVPILALLCTSLVSAAAAGSGDDTSTLRPADAGVDATSDAHADAGNADAQSDATVVDASDGAADGAIDVDVDGAEAGGEVHVQVLAFNDFHGNLRAPSPSNAVVLAKPNDPAVGDAGVPTEAGVVDGGPLNMQLYAGGAVYFAAHVKALRALNPNTLLVSAGDMTGASPLISNTYDDEPTIRVMNAIGVDYNSVGNHEFDHGPSELLRLQYGGCNISDRTDAGGSCFADPTFPGATFQYLAANVEVSSSTQKTLFPAYAIKEIGGAKIAFIGMTLEGTPSIVSASGTAGLSFEDEISTVNTLVPILKQQKVDSIIVLLHQGGFQTGTYDDCVGFSAGTVASGQHDIAAIADALDPAVDAIASAHTHVAYNCVRNGRLLTSAASYGRVITKLDLTIDTATHHVTSKTAKNVAVTRDVAPDPDIKTLVDHYAALIAPIADRPVGHITGDILKVQGANGEAPLGDVAADAILAATQAGGAQLAFTNIGGLRDSLLYRQYYSEGDGVVTFEKAQAVMPFRNKVEIIQCTGAQIIAATQQNVYVQAAGSPKIMPVSHGFTYSWDSTKASANEQNAADPASFMLNGAAIEPTANYLVGTTDFVGNGGDGYTAFTGCTLKQVVGIDLDAFTAYLGANQPVPMPTADRITKTK